MKEACSIGIIGGADGPTAIFVTGSFPWGSILLCTAVLALAVYLIRNRKK